MTLRASQLAAGFLLSASLAAAGAPPAPPQPPLALVGGTLIDVSDFGRGHADVRDAAVVIQGGKIVAAGPRKKVAIPKGAKRVDVSGRYLVPGYADAFAALGKQSHADAYLYFGVTSIVGVDGAPRRPDLFLGANPSPRVYPLAVVGYGMRGEEGKEEAYELSEAETMAEMEGAAQGGAKVVLIHYPITPARTAQIVRKARELRLGTIGELGMTPYLEAARVGVQAFVHTSRYSLGLASEETRLAVAADPFGPPRSTFYRWLAGLDPGDDGLRNYAERLAASPVSLIPTQAMNYLELPGHGNPWAVPGARIVDPADIHQPANPATGERDVAPAPGPDAFPAGVGVGLRRLEGAYARAGARYLAGSGTTAFGTIPGVSLHTELELMRQAGVPPRAVLAAATSALGQTFAWPGIGEIKAGYDADLLVLDADPLGDVANLRAIRMVILKGEILDREKLRAGR